MTRHIIVIGKTGQLARALAQRAGAFGFHVTSYDRQACDLSARREHITQFAESLPQCDGLIIAAAYTAVDAAQEDEKTASQVNAVAPSVFAKLCKARNIPLIHVSTDYVFSGQEQIALREDMQAAPINVYGQSKYDGELAILKTGARAVILRSSWVFDGIGNNFMTTMLRLGETRETLSVVADQIGRPTYAGHLAQACLRAMVCLHQDQSLGGGIYHVSGQGEPISWADFAEVIFSKTANMRDHSVTIKPILTHEYPALADRPAYSVLDVSKFEAQFGTALPRWEVGLALAIDEWMDFLSGRARDKPRE